MDLTLIGYALDHPIRVAILEALGDREVTLSDVARAFAISLPTAYRHVALLAHARLILTARRGRWRLLKRASKTWDLLEQLRALSTASDVSCTRSSDLVEGRMVEPGLV